MILKQWPTNYVLSTGQIWPMTCFLVFFGPQAKNSFYIFLSCKKTRKERKTCDYMWPKKLKVFNWFFQKMFTNPYSIAFLNRSHDHFRRKPKLKFFKNLPLLTPPTCPFIQKSSTFQSFPNPTLSLGKNVSSRQSMWQSLPTGGLPSRSPKP